MSQHAKLARRLLIGGRVQGVGFRPFVFALAGELGLHGSVRNRGGLVEIVAHGEAVQADRFLARLLRDHPPIARPVLAAVEPCPPPDGAGFRILPSLPGAASPTEAAVAPDQTMCPTCLAELFDPTSRRYRYPFIACTQCGPRYTIARAFPFDRQTTCMAAFPLCVTCRREYEDPADRRFHAQVTACPDCGPRLLFRSGSREVTGNEAAMERAVAVLREGAILAVRGIGGYHLMCDATNDHVVRALRDRKRRPTKPLAVMFPRGGYDGLARLRVHCVPDAVEAQILASADRPIVLVPLRPRQGLSPALAPGLCELGAFLPYSPTHELLIGGFGGPLVTTSGNVSGEPVVTDPQDAERLLGPIADAFLHHDRPILRPADDGVARVIAGLARPLRLGRGMAPLRYRLPHALSAPVLALGGQMKVTLALGFGDSVVISPHLGDLGSPRALAVLEATAETLQHLHGVRARTLICDAHPDATGARWARRQGMRVIEVVHHHAHAAAVAGEFADEPRWLCFTWDGVGIGADGTLWGGEALLGRPGVWSRVATFRPFAPPGGDRAAREPWRSAAALAWELGIEWAPDGIAPGLTRAAWEKRLNAPATSSIGRLFDAAASFLDLVQHSGHEAEGPMAVEAAAGISSNKAAALPLSRRADGVWQADWAPLVALLRDETRSRSCRAAEFHDSLALTLLAQAETARLAHGDFAVGLCGGAFQNRRLAEAALLHLARAGFRAHLPLAIPCNDAGLSFGQVVEAAARL